MKLTLILSPVGDLPETSVSVLGSVLTVNGKAYDLSELPDGATAEHPELRKVKRNGNNYECTVRLGLGPNAPYETRFPKPIVLENHNGKIELPLYNAAPDEEEEPTE